jgi:hypothetical protein
MAIKFEAAIKISILFNAIVNDRKQLLKSVCVWLVLSNHADKLGIHVLERCHYALGWVLEVVDDHVDEYLVHSESLFQRVVLLVHFVKLLLELGALVLHPLEFALAVWVQQVAEREHAEGRTHWIGPIQYKREIYLFRLKSIIFKHLMHFINEFAFIRRLFQLDVDLTWIDFW